MVAKPRTARIRQYVIDHVSDHPKDIVGFTATRFNITKQAVLKHVNSLIEQNALSATGKTKARRYGLLAIAEFDFTTEITPQVEEYVVWKEEVGSRLDERVPDNVRGIAEYSFNEMFNNVIDHSGAKLAHTHVTYTPESVSIRLNDDGVGIFRKIKREFNLADELTAIFELSKGKLTTDPDNHTGEGVFFTSRMLDYFVMMSGELCLIHERGDDDWLIEDRKDAINGTYIRMNVRMNTTHSCQDVFNDFADPETSDYSFAKTHVPISLMQYGQDSLVSRSQARRVVNRFESFNEVILNFAGVEFIGRAFADEVFRVFQMKHPTINLVPINANESVSRMIYHAIRNLNAHDGMSGSHTGH